MIRELIERARQGKRTLGYPKGEAVLPERFRGLPVLDREVCDSAGEGGGPCTACAAVCPTTAITLPEGRLALDLGRCLFCTECTEACPKDAIRFTTEHRLAAWSRAALELREGAPADAPKLDEARFKLLRRSLKLRVVSSGGCGACEADVNVLGSVLYDLGRFGIEFVASPRHADGLLLTGPVTVAMRSALEKTYEAIPPPGVVIAVGACACSGGPYVGQAEIHDGVAGLFPVDLWIPGCPPHPLTILDGLLKLIGR